jgi:hypothetical protein
LLYFGGRSGYRDKRNCRLSLCVSCAFSCCAKEFRCFAKIFYRQLLKPRFQLHLQYETFDLFWGVCNILICRYQLLCKPSLALFVVITLCCCSVIPDLGDTSSFPWFLFHRWLCLHRSIHPHPLLLYLRNLGALPKSFFANC